MWSSPLGCQNEANRATKRQREPLSGGDHCERSRVSSPALLYRPLPPVLHRVLIFPRLPGHRSSRYPVSPVRSGARGVWLSLKWWGMSCQGWLGCAVFRLRWSLVLAFAEPALLSYWDTSFREHASWCQAAGMWRHSWASRIPVSRLVPRWDYRSKTTGGQVLKIPLSSQKCELKV